MRHAFLFVGLIAACGGGSSPSDAPAKDAPRVVDARPIDGPAIDGPVIDAPMIDATPATVFDVTCTGATIAATVTTVDGTNAYMPSAVTIAVGGIVKFTTSVSHDVNSTVPGLPVGFSTTACRQFTAAGTFGFFCSIHGFSGSVTVQ
jgi:plastocyanin